MPPNCPFDALTLAAVCEEMQVAVGSNVRKMFEVDDTTIGLVLSKSRARHIVIASCHPTFFRAHLASIQPSKQHHLGHFAAHLTKTVSGGKVLSIRQHNFDRILLVEVGKRGGVWTLAAHLTGTSSNLFLINPLGRVVARLRNTGKIRLGSDYVLPESPANLATALQTKQGLSPFLREQLDRIGAAEVIDRFQSKNAVLIPGHGAYPFQPEGLPVGKRMSSVSLALEQFHLSFRRHAVLDEKKQSLRAQLLRALQSREKALAKLQTAIDESARSIELQLFGDLILANLGRIKPGHDSLVAHDYDAIPRRIPLDPTLTALENANAYFQKAKKAKRGRLHLERSHETKLAEIQHLTSMLSLLDSADEMQLRSLLDTARASGFLRETKSTATKKERPFGGHKISAVQSPSGFTVLWGQTATANDYLIKHLARPNDIWLHVRGHVGSHVIIQTNDKPNRVQKDTIMFAAAIAAKNSGQKHSKHVTVDYTFAKYVRKPKGSKPGTVAYINEKSVFVEQP